MRYYGDSYHPIFKHPVSAGDDQSEASRLEYKMIDAVKAIISAFEQNLKKRIVEISVLFIKSSRLALLYCSKLQAADIAWLAD
jgi:hypothetical protein